MQIQLTLALILLELFEDFCLVTQEVQFKSNLCAKNSKNVISVLDDEIAINPSTKVLLLKQAHFFARVSCCCYDRD